MTRHFTATGEVMGKPGIEEAQEMVRRYVKTGRMVRAKLTRALAVEMCERYLAGGVSQSVVASEYGVSQTYVHKLVGDYLHAQEHGYTFRPYMNA